MKILLCDYIYAVSMAVKAVEIASRTVVSKNCQGRNKELLFNGHRVSILKDEEF